MQFQTQTLPSLTKAIKQPAIVRTRVQAIDLWRGIVMIIMALDHTRDFIHLDTLSGQNPLDFSTTSTWLFLTRWVTHLCAPSFVFLSGTSIFFVSQRKTKNDMAFFLFTGGLWLIFLELTFLNFAWAGASGYTLLGLGVIWVIGLCMVLAVFSFLSFIDTTKYPPSLLYMLMTIGPTLLFIAFAERLKGKLVDAISVFGRVPLFYYILHIILIHAISWIIFWAQGYSMLFVDIRYNPTIPKGIGVSLGWVYVIWLTVILVLYWPCKWYNTYKSTHNHWWLSYL